MNYEKKPKVKAYHSPLITNATLHLALHDEAGMKLLPNLHELLMSRYEDNKMTRQEGTIRVQQRGPVWSVSLECPTEGVQTSFEAPSLVDLFEILEATLAAGKAVWSPNWKNRKRDLTRLEANQ